MRISIGHNGDLVLTREPSDADVLSAYTREHGGYLCVMHALFEPHSTNGRFYFLPHDVRIGLTDAPFICEFLDIDDDGATTAHGRTWWFPDYQTRDDLEELCEGSVIYKRIEERR